MFQATSSPQFVRRDDSSFNSRPGNRDFPEKFSASVSDLDRKDKSPRAAFTRRVEHYHEEPPFEATWDGQNLASACPGDMFRNYASVYNSFDARNYFSSPNYDHELNVHAETSTIPYADTGETEYDVKFIENRVAVPSFIELKPLELLGSSKGLRSHGFLDNKTGLNLSFFIKASSPLIHIKESVGWMLPHEKLKIHMKTYAPYDKISKEFLLVFIVPIYFPEQLNMLKLKQYWEALGSELLPLDYVECHRIDKLVPSKEVLENFSILERIRSVRSWFTAPTLVQTPPCIDLNDYPGYVEFWNLKEEDLEVAMACHFREAQRSLRRSLQEKVIIRKWPHVLSAAFVMILCTAVILNYCLGFTHLPSGSGWENFLNDMQYSPSLENILIPPPPPPPPEEVPDLVLCPAGSQPDTVTWCHLYAEASHPRWIPFLCTRCLLTKLWDFLGSIATFGHN